MRKGTLAQIGPEELEGYLAPILRHILGPALTGA